MNLEWDENELEWTNKGADNNETQSTVVLPYNAGRLVFLAASSHLPLMHGNLSFK